MLYDNHSVCNVFIFLSETMAIAISMASSFAQVRNGISNLCDAS